MQYGLIMEQMSCARRSGERWQLQSFRSMFRERACLTKFRKPQSRNAHHQLASATNDTYCCVAFAPLLCNKTMTAQSLASKSCVGVTKRPMATGGRSNTELKAMATCQRRPIIFIPISSCTNNKKKQTKNNATTRPLPRPQLIKIAQAAKAHSKQWTLIIYNFLSWTNSYYFGFEKLAPEEH